MSDQYEPTQAPTPKRSGGRWATPSSLLSRYDGRMTAKQEQRIKALRAKLADQSRLAKANDPSTVTERLTDNTLIRAALELLFLFEADVAGYTETDITASVLDAAHRLRAGVHVDQAARVMDTARELAIARGTLHQDGSKQTFSEVVELARAANDVALHGERPDAAAAPSVPVGDPYALLANPRQTEGQVTW